MSPLSFFMDKMKSGAGKQKIGHNAKNSIAPDPREGVDTRKVF